MYMGGKYYKVLREIGCELDSKGWGYGPMAGS